MSGMDDDKLQKAIERIEALVRLRGQQMSPVLVGDLQVLIENAKKTMCNRN